MGRGQFRGICRGWGSGTPLGSTFSRGAESRPRLDSAKKYKPPGGAPDPLAPYDVRPMLTALLLASFSDKIVEPIVDVATEFIGSAGVVAVFLLMALESACIPIPSEAIMLFAGFSVSQGELTLVGIVAAGVLGNLVGSSIAYALGYYGRLDLLERNRLIHVSPTPLRQPDDAFH